MIVTQDWFRDAMPARTAVLLSGGFDPLHWGHIRFIRRADWIATMHEQDEDTVAVWAEGSAIMRARRRLHVVVAVAPDSYIERKHPVLQTLDYRMEMVDAVKGVDYVLAQGEETAASAIRAVRPYIFLKGSDWEKRGLPRGELDAVEEVGASVVYVPVHDVSSSQLLRDFFWRHADEMVGRA